MKDIICFGMVIAAYALGHVGGYRMCKIRIKNLLLRKIKDTHPEFRAFYSSALSEVVAL